jgi:hypothetical protein
MSICWYSINESVDCVDTDTVGEIVEVQMQMEIADDLRDLDSLIWWSDRYEKTSEFPPTEEGAKAAAEAFRVADIDWDGEEFSQ